MINKERWRAWLWPGVAALVFVLLAAWLVSATEWADTDFYVPPKGEAARNPLYAAQELARDLGVSVTLRTTLEQPPPPGATLVLTSGYWDLLPGRQQALRDWVRQGGQLVIASDMLKPRSMEKEEETKTKTKTAEKPGVPGDWLPVRWAESKPKPENETQAKGEDKTEPPACSKPSFGGCHYLGETGKAAGPGFRICWFLPEPLELKPGATGLWSAGERDGPVLLRAAFGQGSVTVIGIWGAMTDEDILKADHAQAFVAALGLRPGMALWFVNEESRNSLLAWLWQRGWVALLLGLLALAAGLWRGAPRFGPRLALPRLERRSMAEQIIGTAHFLARSDAPALHQAQLRALDEAAAPRLRRWAKLDAAARARAVAATTGLPADAVARAMSAESTETRNAARLEADLCCLEAAVRRLRAGSVSAANAVNRRAAATYPSS